MKLLLLLIASLFSGPLLAQEVVVYGTTGNNQPVVISNSPATDLTPHRPTVVVSVPDFKVTPQPIVTNSEMAFPPSNINAGIKILNDSENSQINSSVLDEAVRARIEDYIKDKVISKGCEFAVKTSYSALQKFCLSECLLPEPNKYICGIGTIMKFKLAEGAIKSGAEQGCVFIVKKGEKETVELYLKFKIRVLKDIDQLKFWFSFINTVEGSQWLMGKLTDISI